MVKMMEVEKLNDDEIFLLSLQAFKQELLGKLTADNTMITNAFNEWMETRVILIQSMLNICEKLKVARRKSNKATVTTSSVSLVGGVAMAGGLFATSAISLPLVALGGIFSFIGSMGQVSVSAGEALISHSLLKKCEEDIKKDADCLDRLLKYIDEFESRVQCFERELREKQEDRRKRQHTDILSYGVQFGIIITDYMRAFKQMDLAIVNATKSVSIYQKLSNIVKASSVYRAIFRTTVKDVATNTAKAGGWLMGKRVFAVLGILFDINNIANARKELGSNSYPETVLELEKTVDKLILEKAEIQESFFLTSL